MTVARQRRRRRGRPRRWSAPPPATPRRRRPRTPSRGGLQPIVLLPAGRIAAGKLAQAIVHGAQVVQIEGNFDDCLRAGPHAGRRAIRWPWSTRSTRSGSRGRRPPPSRSSTTSATPRTCTCCRSATAGTSRPTGGATSSTREAGIGPPAPRGCGRFQAAGAAPLVLGHPVLDPETVATAIRIGDPASTTLAVAAKEESGGRSRRSPIDEILAAQGFLAAREGIFVEPASAAGVAGLIALAERGEVDVRAADRGHGDRPRAEGHRHRPVGPDRCRPRWCAADLLAIASVCGLVD